MFSLREEVKDFDKAFEFLWVRGILGEQLLIKVVLVVKFSYLGLLVDHNGWIVVPVGAR
jgi:hypothetical protein